MSSHHISMLITEAIHSQLAEIQRRFHENDTPHSRFGIWEVQNKMKIWDELNANLDEILKVHTVRWL